MWIERNFNSTGDLLLYYADSYSRWLMPKMLLTAGETTGILLLCLTFLLFSLVMSCLWIFSLHRQKKGITVQVEEPKNKTISYIPIKKRVEKQVIESISGLPPPRRL